MFISCGGISDPWDRAACHVRPVYHDASYKEVVSGSDLHAAIDPYFYFFCFSLGMTMSTQPCQHNVARERGDTDPIAGF